jgi:hypothetical protein
MSMSILPISTIVQVQASPTEPFEMADDPVLTETFEEIWEQEARWITGPHFITGIVQYMKGKSLVAKQGDPNRLDICIPIPTTTNEIDGSEISVSDLIPPELQPIFVYRCSRIMAYYSEEASRLEWFLGQLMTPATIAQANGLLQEIERNRQAYGRGELWKVAATEFGLDWRFLPKPMTFAALSP